MIFSTTGPKALFAGLPALYCATFLLAINGVLSKAIQADAITITCLRCLIAFFALLLFTVWHNTAWGFTSIQHRLMVCGLGVLMAIHWSTFFQAMQVSTVAIGILAHYSAPVVTVILEPLLDKKLPKPKDLFAASLVVLGLAMMVPQWRLDNNVMQGIGYGLISALTFASRNVLQRRWLKNESGSQGMVLQVAVAALITLPFAQFAQTALLPPMQWGYILALGLISTALAHTLIAVSLRTLAAKSVSLISCFQPPLAILLSWWLLQEIPSTSTFFGGGIILGCACYEALQHKNTAPAQLS